MERQRVDRRRASLLRGECIRHLSVNCDFLPALRRPFCLRVLVREIKAVVIQVYSKGESSTPKIPEGNHVNLQTIQRRSLHDSLLLMMVLCS
jgi:hypothetical protein